VLFHDRTDAGRRLAGHLAHLRGEDVVVLGLPRGGVPVAAEIAQALNAPLDVILVRKLGVPFHEELAMGAIGEGDVVVRNEDIVHVAHVTEEQLAEVRRREQVELDERSRRYRGEAQRVPLEHRTAVVVDDGIATGATVRAACAVARAHGARRVVLAAPVSSPTTAEQLGRDADEVLVLETPHSFAAVGQAYGDFAPTEDDEVVRLLGQGPSPAQEATAPHPRAGRPWTKT
jgi:putative phosphoribosyl transferase